MLNHVVRLSGQETLGNSHYSCLVQWKEAIFVSTALARGRERRYWLDWTHVPNLHIIMRRADWDRLRQPSASTSSILIWGSVWGFPSMTPLTNLPSDPLDHDRHRITALCGATPSKSNFLGVLIRVLFWYFASDERLTVLKLSKWWPVAEPPIGERTKMKRGQHRAPGLGL
jgi:hypothetical protein